MHIESRIVRPDAKGRITLGELAKGVSSFRVTKQKNGLLLKPYIEVPQPKLPKTEAEIEALPERERWLYRNPEALAMVLQGINDAANGKLHYRGSFAHYLEEDDEDSDSES